MKTTTLELKTLHQLSDDLAADFMQQIEAAVLDCKQRPSLAAKREVNLRLTITPHPEDPEDVVILPVTTRKMPARKIDPIRARRTGRNQLQFDWNDDEQEP
jgi:hypothetical protein